MNGAELTKWAMSYIEDDLGSKAINLIAASKSGNADIIACIDGRYCEFEIKGEGDKIKPAQTVKLNKTIELGGVAGYVTCKKDLYELVVLVTDSGRMKPIETNIEKVTL